MLVNDHDEDKRGKIKGQLYSEHKFGLCRSFKKITKNLSFPLTIKKTDLKDYIYSQ